MNAAIPEGVRIFGAPHRYYQGPGAIEQLGGVLSPFGATPVLVADEFVLDMLGARLSAICVAAGLRPILRPFAREITYPAIAELEASLDGAQPGIAVGIGGGKSLDAAKALAKSLDIPVVTVPTIASNDSPTSGSIAMYDDHHVMIAVDRLARSPEAVIVDTALIAAAPIRFLRAGIGDAISKKFEADGCLAGTGVTPFGTRPTRTAIAIANACYETIRAHGRGAMMAAERGEATDDLEAVVEAAILMSGLGFENGGLSLAHSLTRGLVKVRGAKNAIHGDQISWALLVQFAAEGRSDSFIRELLDFYAEIGLPAQLEDIGMPNATGDEVAEIARWTMTAPHLANLETPVDEAVITAAILRAETLAADRT
jgi:glycerol dehydrogenase